MYTFMLIKLWLAKYQVICVDHDSVFWVGSYDYFPEHDT